MRPGPLMIDVAGVTLSAEERERLAHPLVGGLILFTRNYRDREQLAALVAAARAARPGLLVAADTEGGRVQRFREGFFRLPAMRSLGTLYAADAGAGLAAARAAGWMLAAELLAVGVDLAFAPVLDLDHGASAVIGDRALESDPERVIELATAVCAGMRAAGMAPTGKHFPGHGSVAPDSHAELPVDERDWADIAAADLVPFARLAPTLESMMVAHIRFPAIDSLPASLSPRWINEILRQRLGFAGAVFADDLGMGGARACGDILERAGLALAAGCDMLPVCNDPDEVIRLLDEWHGQPAAEAAARLQPLQRAQQPPRPLDPARRQAAVAALNPVMESSTC